MLGGKVELGLVCLEAIEERAGNCWCLVWPIKGEGAAHKRERERVIPPMSLVLSAFSSLDSAGLAALCLSSVSSPILGPVRVTFCSQETEKYKNK